MKLSFSLASKPSSKPNPKPLQTFVTEDHNDGGNNNTNLHEFVTEFDASKPLEGTHPRKFVIPPKENEWPPIKKMKNIDLPVRSNGGDLQFEIESPSLAEFIDSGMSFGLNIRQSVKDYADDGVKSRSEAANGDEKGPPRSVPAENVLLQKLKGDLKRLPEHRGLEEFDDVPVDGFGAALLAGYGWYEGRGIGKNAKGDVKVVQYERRTGKEGLGFVADTPVRDIHKVGKDVRIIGGRDMGCKGRIVEVLDFDSVVLKLLRNGEEVRVRVHDIAYLGSEEEEKCLRKLKDLKIQIC